MSADTITGLCIIGVFLWGGALAWTCKRLARISRDYPPIGEDRWP